MSEESGLIPGELRSMEAKMMNRPDKEFRIKVTNDGPYIVTGGVPLAQDIVVIGSDGEPEKREKGPGYPDQESYALCRCGQSKNKPFCDGAHISIGLSPSTARPTKPPREPEST